jgi:hypothetical protein
MLKNVQIHFPDRVPDPTLYEVIEKLALLKPNLIFVHDKDHTHHSSNRPIHRAYNESLDAGKSYACKFRVMDNGIVAGYLYIQQNYARNAGKNWRIGVTSHLIHTERGPRNTKSSSDVAKALSNAKKYLCAKSMGRILYEARSDAYTEANSVVSNLRYPVTRGSFLTSIADTQILLHAYMTNNVASFADIDSAVRAKILTPTFDKSMSEYYLAKLFSDLEAQNKMTFIQQIDGMYVSFSGEPPATIDMAETAAVTIMEFEELPTATQDKIGVLRLVQNRELVKDMGIRVNDDSFILM